MLKAEYRHVAVVVLFLLLSGLFFSGCSQTPRNHWWQFWRPKEEAPVIWPQDTKDPDDAPLPAPPEPSQEEETTGDVEPIPWEGEETGQDVTGSIPAPQEVREPSEPVSELQTVHFAFDSAELDEQSKAVLDQNYEWMKNHPGYHFLIEGHCDERGTVEYNLNLGQRRADAVREYLIKKGLVAETLHTISYGEERPLVEGDGKEAWSKNRRVQFLIY